jgi:acetyl-CoA synthetase
MEEKIFYPSKKIIEKALIKDYEKVYQESIKNPEKFWEKEAEELEWFKKWDKVLEWNPPFARWFIGAKCNLTVNILDRQLKRGLADKIALIWEGQSGEVKKLTYQELYEEVCRFANVLKKFGLKKGDRATIYLPRIPEQIISILACARIGVIHSVVYSGFSVEALRTRILDAESKIVITADHGRYREKLIKLKEMVDEAITETPSVKNVIVVKNSGEPVPMKEGRDFWWHEIKKTVLSECPPEIMDAEDILFLLYSSGTTGTPKGIIHTQAGYMVGIYTTMKYVFNPTPDDIYWCTADPGWITGHSYIVYAPLIFGLTEVLYEGAPDYPGPDRFWQIIDKHKVTIFYTTPTALRALMRYGDEYPRKYKLDSLKILGTVGEPINPDVWLWYYQEIGHNQCPIMDTWWQTETGMHMITPIPSMPLKAGSAGKPFFGIIADVVDDNGKPVEPGKDGYLVLKNPWPAMLRTLYKNEKRYRETYWEKIPGVYFTGDGAKKDKDGYYWITGRVDDVLKVSGYRLGSAEIESALVAHEAVVEAAVIGKPDPVKGEAIKAFVILKKGYNGTPELIEELKKWVRKEIGPIAVPSEIEFVESLPKTRSGKIMRRVLKAKELGLPIGDISTLEE